MPKLTKQFTLDITVQRFLNACSDDEIYELWLLLSSPKYQGIIKGKENIAAPKPVAPKKKVTLPFAGVAFAQAWQEWKEYKAKEHGFKFKSAISERKSLKRLFYLSAGNEQRAIAIINRSIENGWSGLFVPPIGYHPKPNKTERKNFE